MQEQIELLEKVKKELGISQIEIAQKLEVGEATISEWANGRRKMKKPIKLLLKYMLQEKEHQEAINTLKTFRSLLAKI